MHGDVIGAGYGDEYCTRYGNGNRAGRGARAGYEAERGNGTNADYWAGHTIVFHDHITII